MLTKKAALWLPGAAEVFRLVTLGERGASSSSAKGPSPSSTPRSVALRRVALELQEVELLPVPGVAAAKNRDTLLASLLRELLTTRGGKLEACAGAVLLDKAGQLRGLTVPFGAEWPRADAQALELFTTAKRTGWPRLVLFRVEPNPRAQPELMALQLGWAMRALGLLFGVEVEDLLLLTPKGHFSLSRLPVLGASLHCEATLNRALDCLIASGFERLLPQAGPPRMTNAEPPGTGNLIDGPWGELRSEGE